MERGFAAAKPRDAAGRPYPSVRIVLARRLSVAGHGLVAPRRKSPEGNLTMPSTEKLDTHHKALTLNLDASAFGSFAEIGAGQEVARWFLVVGGASGTVAKTISAYDKEVSDDLYGSGSRYVSRQRLEAMLDHEWSQLLTQLSKTRGPQTRFFSFVDTVSARNFAGTNEPHGWMGLRFQLQPGGPPNDVLLHINLLDPSNLLQQEAGSNQISRKREEIAVTKTTINIPRSRHCDQPQQIAQHSMFVTLDRTTKTSQD